MYVVHLLRAMQHMKTYAYTRFRLANTWLRLQLREGLVVICFVITSMLVLTLINHNACSSRIIETLGVVPIAFMWSVLLLCRSFYLSPVVANPKHTLLMERQAFAWSSDEEAREGQEPMFCYQTALKMLFWSVLAYRETKVRGAVLLFSPPFVSAW